VRRVKKLKIFVVLVMAAALMGCVSMRPTEKAFAPIDYTAIGGWIMSIDPVCDDSVVILLYQWRDYTYMEVVIDEATLVFPAGTLEIYSSSVIFFETNSAVMGESGVLRVHARVLTGVFAGVGGDIGHFDSNFSFVSGRLGEYVTFEWAECARITYNDEPYEGDISYRPVYVIFGVNRLIDLSLLIEVIILE